MKKIAVIGLGRFGIVVARALASAGAEVIAIDSNPERVEEIRDDVNVAVRLDSTDEKSLESQGIGDVDVAVIGIGEDFEANQLTTVMVKKMGVPKVIARASSEIRSKILKLIGADEVIIPEDYTALRLSQKLITPNVVDYLPIAPGHSVVEINAPKEFHNKSILELNIRKKYKITVVAIKRKMEKGGEERIDIIAVPGADDKILPEDTLVVVGQDKKILEISEGE